MINREIITNVLDEMGMIYELENASVNGIEKDTYLIKFFVNNNLVYGGITDSGNNEDSHINFLFFFETEKKDENAYIDLLSKVNFLNMSSKYGNFYLDEDKDIVFSIAVPVLGEKIEKDVVKFYLNSAISIISDVAEDVFYEE